VWTRLDALDFSPGAPVLKLDLVSRPDRVGDVSGTFAPGETLEYLPASGTAA
jgi:hypothetical protein